MADVFNLNKPNGVYADDFKSQYFMTMTMLKAGWLLKASSSGSGGSKSLSANPMNCMWGAPAAVSGQSGTVASIGAQTGKDFLFTGLTGLVIPTRSNQGGSEGDILVISGASLSSPGNNTSWLISKVVSATSCYARPLVPTAVTHVSTGPAMTLWGHLCHTREFNLRVIGTTGGVVSGGAAQVQISLNGGSTYAAAVTIPATGILEIIGSEGVHTGVFASFVTSGTVVLTDVWTATSAVASDANNGAISWTQYSWLGRTYTTYTASQWILLEGPLTMKIPFNGPGPVGTFFRGENVVQTGSGAEGECLGVSYEPSTGVGYMVVQPRLQGSGAGPLGPEGWSASGRITGSRSAAYVDPSAVPNRYHHEIMWMHGTNLGIGGTAYYSPAVDDAIEAAQRFSRLAQEAGCTATVAPAMGGTNNGFPTLAYVGPGTGGSVGHTNYSAWRIAGWAYNTGTTISNAQIFAANCIERQNTSQDGSFMGLLGQPLNSTTSCSIMQSFHRVDNQAEGDIDPYVGGPIAIYPASIPGRSRTSQPNQMNGSEANTCQPQYMMCVNQGTYVGGFAGWRKRGLAGDAWQEYTGGFISTVNGTPHGTSSTISDPERIGSTAMTVSPLILDPVFLIASGIPSGSKDRKGTLRWLFFGDSNGSAWDTWNSKMWMQPNVPAINNPGTSATFFPWDGTTVPAQ